LLGSGSAGQNCLARDDSGVLWSTRRTGPTLAWVYDLTVIDASSGAATVIHSNVPDLRGLANAGGTMLWGIVNTVAGSTTSIDTLVLIDTSSGTFTTIGTTGLAALQGLTMHQGILYSWDLNLGLVTIDPTTGLATDPFPAAGAFNGQYLCSHPDGRLIVGPGTGAAGLHVVDTTTGLTTLIGPLVGATDLRGLDPIANASCTLRNGTGINPVACTCVTLPILGTVWSLDVAPGPYTLLTLLFASETQLPPIPLFGGELLIGPNVIEVGTNIALPALPQYVGYQVSMQGVRLDLVGGALAIVFTNAQDAVLDF
ncbi:MAG TPA: hypothetical protein VFT55_13780, partial [Planctomycetota bacterium]|nr:hypothetical protein [Planctomycetota bacterium]